MSRLAKWSCLHSLLNEAKCKKQLILQISWKYAGDQPQILSYIISTILKVKSTHSETQLCLCMTQNISRIKTRFHGVIVVVAVYSSNVE